MTASEARAKLAQLRRDPSGELAKLELRLDVLDAEIDLEGRVRFQETKEKLERAGFDVSNYRPTPPRHPARSAPETTSVTTRSSRSSLPPRNARPTAPGANTTPKARSSTTRPAPHPKTLRNRDHDQVTARAKIPGTRKNPVLYVGLPPIPDDAPDEIKDAFALANATAVEGECSHCGAHPSSPPTRARHRDHHLRARP